jgi:hypothetical protein
MTQGITIPIPITNPWAKITMFIKTPTKVITESHWFNDYTQSDDQVLYNWITAFATGTGSNASLCTWRGFLLPQNTAIYEVRCSRETIRGDSAVSTFPTGTANSLGGFESTGNVCMDIRLESGTLSRKTLYLGALPGAIVSNDGYVPSGVAGWSTALTNYLTGLAGGIEVETRVNSIWGYLGQDTTQLPWLISGIVCASTSGGTTITVTTFPNHGYSPGDVVLISGVKNTSQIFPFNQRWKIVSVPTANSFTLPLLSNVTQPGASFGPYGEVRRLRHVFLPYNNAILGQIRTRKRGGRTGLPLGRSKRRSLPVY